MQEQRTGPQVLWLSAAIGAVLGLIGGWSASPMFLFMPIRQDSPLYDLPDDAGIGAQALSFVGQASVNLLHFLMWVGGSAALAVLVTAYVGSLLTHR